MVISAAFKERQLKFTVKFSMTYAYLVYKLFFTSVCLSCFKRQNTFLRFRVFSILCIDILTTKICSITHFVRLSIPWFVCYATYERCHPCPVHPKLFKYLPVKLRHFPWKLANSIAFHISLKHSINLNNNFKLVFWMIRFLKNICDLAKAD